ncbi:MAG: hypothetical protein N4A35_08610 [Flavobacteriales bacterium]|jgi:hypothetical protein|nr:hypothetical protein [Flavobacteriales bacterium]
MQKKSSTYQFYNHLENLLGVQCDETVEFIPYESYNTNVVSNKFKVYQDWWVAKPEVVVSKIKALMGASDRIFARKTKLKKIDKPTANAFLEENHIYGTTKAKHKIGLFYKNDLVAVATFSAQRNLAVGRSSELIRFCSKNGTVIVGGLDKLLKYYIKEYSPDHIMTYVDKDWGSGEAFLNLGFELTSERAFNRYTVDRTSGKRMLLTGKNVANGLSIKNSGSSKLELIV